MVASSWDQWLAERTHSPFDAGRFRTPTLRNVGLREPLGLGAFDLTLEELAALTAFVREALTDPRVAKELPPFDHPALAHP